MHITLYSDGGSVNNGKKDPDKPVYGSFATLLVSDDDEIIEEISEVAENVTNNQMELYGCIIGLLNIKQLAFKKKETIDVDVFSDSQYVIKGSTEWMENWIKRGWKNNEGKPVSNKTMWQMMEKILNSKYLNINFNWIRGHKGKSIDKETDRNIYFNEKCDSIIGHNLSIYRT